MLNLTVPVSFSRRQRNFSITPNGQWASLCLWSSWPPFLCQWSLSSANSTWCQMVLMLCLSHTKRGVWWRTYPTWKTMMRPVSSWAKFLVKRLLQCLHIALTWALGARPQWKWAMLLMDATAVGTSWIPLLNLNCDHRPVAFPYFLGEREDSPSGGHLCFKKKNPSRHA